MHLFSYIQYEFLAKKSKIPIDADEVKKHGYHSKIENVMKSIKKIRLKVSPSFCLLHMDRANLPFRFLGRRMDTIVASSSQNMRK